MDTKNLKIILIFITAMFFAVYLGIAAATAQMEAIAWILGTAGLVTVLALGKNVWLLIPFGLVLEGTLNAMPGSPPVWAAGTLVTVGMFALRIAMHKQDFSYKFDILDLAIVTQIIAIAQSYVRNPTGLMLFGGDTAGGKPYLTFAVAVAAYICLGMVKSDLRMFRVAVIMMICAMLIDGTIGILSDFVPALAAFVLPIYSNTNVGVAISGQAMSSDLSEARGGGSLGKFGKSIGTVCFSMFRPLNCLIPTHPLLVACTVIAVVLVLLSGFRNMLVYLAVVYAVSALLRQRMIDIMVASVSGVLVLCVLMMSGQIRNLPFGVQRALSFLPVEVSEAAKEDAENSSEWRFKMWEIALTTDKYIQNKWLGDGFAISAREMRAQLDAAMGYRDRASTGSELERMESFLARGSYHGFHVETIRFTGVMGLASAIFIMWVCFPKALRLARHYRGTPIFPYVALVCIPFLIYPFWSLLVFGAYRSDFPQFIASAGLLKMLEQIRFRELAQPVQPAVETGRKAVGQNGVIRPAPAHASSARI